MDGDEEEEEDADAAAMAAMGFGGFGSTKVSANKDLLGPRLTRSGQGSRGQCRRRGQRQEAEDLATVHESPRRFQQASGPHQVMLRFRRCMEMPPNCLLF